MNTYSIQDRTPDEARYNCVPKLFLKNGEPVREGLFDGLREFVYSTARDDDLIVVFDSAPVNVALHRTEYRNSIRDLLELAEQLALRDKIEKELRAEDMDEKNQRKKELEKAHGERG